MLGAAPAARSAIGTVSTTMKTNKRGEVLTRFSFDKGLNKKVNIALSILPVITERVKRNVLITGRYESSVMRDSLI